MSARRVTCPNCGYPSAFDGRRCWACGSGSGSEPKPDDEHALDHELRAAIKTECARRIWSKRRAPQGTPVERYLERRGLDGPIPPSIAYAELRHVPTGQVLPCMVAAVTQWPERQVVAVHRTYLTEEGEKAPVIPPRMALGPIAGGAVRLAPAGKTLVIGEGIETTSSAMRLVDMPGWAALSTSGMEVLVVPETVISIFIAADHDRPGLLAAHRAASRFKREGRAVRIIFPPRAGSDFNDMVMAGCGRR